MTAPAAGQVSTQAHELASKIYIELIGRSAGTEGAAKLLANAGTLAALSLKLAETFLAVEDKADATRAPKVAFELDADSMAQWSAGAAKAKG
jgi:hypothetical protein